MVLPGFNGVMIWVVMCLNVNGLCYVDVDLFVRRENVCKSGKLQQRVGDG